MIGDRTAGDEVTYPDIDLELKAGPDGVRGFRRKDGTPYPGAARTLVAARAKSSGSGAGRCRLGEATFVGMGDKEEDAPKAGTPVLPLLLQLADSLLRERVFAD